jgi:hypothetical protein
MVASITRWRCDVQSTWGQKRDAWVIYDAELTTEDAAEGQTAGWHLTFSLDFIFEIISMISARNSLLSTTKEFSYDTDILNV